MLLIFQSILHSSSRGRSWIKHRRCLTQMAFRLDRESSSLPPRGPFCGPLNPAVHGTENAGYVSHAKRTGPCVSGQAKKVFKQDDAAVRAFATEPKDRLRMESNRCDGRPRLISEPDTLVTPKATV
jgi:hypothetical protein